MSKAVDFCEADFMGRASFVSAKQNGQTLQVFFGASNDCVVDFRNLVVQSPEKIVFRDCDLRSCRFVGTDLRKAEITNAQWRKMEGRSVVYDEFLLRQGTSINGIDTDWAHVESLYRQLKQNFEDRKDYERAGDFHYGEKEMRRLNPETPAMLRRVLWLYKWLSGYGEDLVRALKSVGLLFLTSWICYLLFGLKFKNGCLESTALTGFGEIFEAANYTIRAMTHLKPDEAATPASWGATIVFLIDSFVGPFLIGLFGLALRQRLKR